MAETCLSSIRIGRASADAVQKVYSPIRQQRLCDQPADGWFMTGDQLRFSVTDARVFDRGAVIPHEGFDPLVRELMC